MSAQYQLGLCGNCGQITAAVQQSLTRLGQQLSRSYTKRRFSRLFHLPAFTVEMRVIRAVIRNSPKV